MATSYEEETRRFQPQYSAAQTLGDAVEAEYQRQRKMRDAHDRMRQAGIPMGSHPELSGFAPLPPRGPFQVGDIVRLKRGAAPQEVIELQRRGAGNSWFLRAAYVGAVNDPYATETRWRTADDYTLHGDEVAPSKEDGNMAQKLYQTKDGKTFGTLLARNSLGQLVLEIKGTGEVKAFDNDELDEVRPYTIGVTNLQGGSVTHFEVTKDKFVIGDLLVDSGGFWLVAHLDSHGQNAKPFKGRRAVTEEI